MFQSEGQHEVKITEACLSVSPYDKSERDHAVALHLQDLHDAGQSDWWYGVLNNDYGLGNEKERRRWELTVENLEKIGWKHGNRINDENLQSLVGVITEVKVKSREYNGKTYYDAKYLGPASFGPKRVKSKDVEAELREMFGSAAVAEPAPAAAPAAPKSKAAPKAAAPAPAPVVDENPFG
jgi:hypothetical protein